MSYSVPVHTKQPVLHILSNLGKLGGMVSPFKETSATTFTLDHPHDLYPGKRANSTWPHSHYQQGEAVLPGKQEVHSTNQRFLSPVPSTETISE